MPCNDVYASIDCIVMGSMNTAFPAVFNDRIFRRPTRPAGMPSRKMVFQGKAFDKFVLGRICCQTVFKPCIMVAQGPNKLHIRTCLFCNILNLTHRYFTSFEFLYFGWCGIPANSWIARNTSAIKNIPIGNNCIGSKFFNSP